MGTASRADAARERYAEEQTAVTISWLFNIRLPLEGMKNRNEGKWRRRSESNRWIKVLQTSALPLGYAAYRQTKGEGRSASSSLGLRLKTLERETGFEPATSTLARSHSTAELLPLATVILSANFSICQLNPFKSILGGEWTTD